MSMRGVLSFSLSAGTIVLMVLLSACSSAPKAVPSTSASHIVPEPLPEVKKVARPRPVASPRRPAPQSILVSQRIDVAAPSQPAESRESRIISLVTAGRLKSSADDHLVFVNSAPASNTSLYEDAITLGRLRGRLQTLPAASDALISSANISNGGAYLVIGSDLTAAEAAEVIDTALKTKDVVLVKARLK
jgi:hypothetical protein